VNDRTSTARTIFLILMPVWAGAIIGVSLIATPVKFQAPSLSIPAGLEVGRYTFRLFSRVELCFLIGVIIAASIAQPGWVTVLVLALVAVQVLLQHYWLLPVLDHRVSDIVAGGPVLFSTSHWVYAALEVLKATLLIGAAVIECCSQRWMKGQT
jgi:hypothetical protein